MVCCATCLDQREPRAPPRKAHVHVRGLRGLRLLGLHPRHDVLRVGTRLGRFARRAAGLEGLDLAGVQDGVVIKIEVLEFLLHLLRQAEQVDRPRREQLDEALVAAGGALLLLVRVLHDHLRQLLRSAIADGIFPRDRSNDGVVLCLQLGLAIPSTADRAHPCGAFQDAPRAASARHREGFGFCYK